MDSKEHVAFRVLTSEVLPGTKGFDILQVEWEVDFAQDVGYQLLGKGTWEGRWRIYLLDLRALVVQGTWKKDTPFSQSDRGTITSVLDSLKITRLDVERPPLPTPTPSPSLIAAFCGGGSEQTATFTVTVESSPWTLWWFTNSFLSWSMKIKLRDASTGDYLDLLVNQTVKDFNLRSTLVSGRIGSFFLDISGPP